MALDNKDAKELLERIESLFKHNDKLQQNFLVKNQYHPKSEIVEHLSKQVEQISEIHARHKPTLTKIRP